MRKIKNVKELSVKAFDIRQNALDIIMAGGGGHIGGDMSEPEILLTLYERMNVTPETQDSPDRDRFVLSKGHCVETLYAVLAYEGFMNLDEVKAKFSKFGSEYIGHPHNTLPGIEMNSGSLGHGLSVSVGMALAGKMDGKNYRVYTLMGDGELAEGSVWEGAAAGGHYRLDNLCALVDHNHLQISGNVDEVLSPGNIALRFEASGWNVINVMNGNDIQQISDALDVAERTKGKPTVIIAETLKGKASPLIENKAGWHHKLPTQEEYERISADIAAYKEALING
ncbi:MAG: transketolase [Synergistaceae bacterium]|nr:transketolase [Synergistaceae bacterium]MBQ3585310.1 transketolase [Synergistaceae bacterium]MBR0279409.1 transketolase [Synergistaceae bacterium]